MNSLILSLAMIGQYQITYQVVPYQETITSYQIVPTIIYQAPQIITYQLPIQTYQIIPFQTYQIYQSREIEKIRIKYRRRAY